MLSIEQFLDSMRKIGYQEEADCVEYFEAVSQHCQHQQSVDAASMAEASTLFPAR